MDNDREFIVASDWTKNWNASIAVKITAITLWPTIVVVFLTAYFMLNNLEQQVSQQYKSKSVEIAFQASSIWPNEDIPFLEKLEKLRHDYRELKLPGFELSKNDQIFSIGNLILHTTYYDIPLDIEEKDNSHYEIRVFFPDAKLTAESKRNKIIGAILLSLMVFGVFLSAATHIIVNKPLRLLVDATQKISEGQLQVRVDTSRQDEFGTLSRFFNKMVDNLIEQEDLEHAAKTDFLTGIANRRQFDDSIKYELRRNARTNTPLTLIMCDVDYFKQYNDIYNHVAGDLCLKHIARTLEGVFNRSEDLVARYGGEEFVIILPNTNSKTGSNLAETLREQIVALKIPHSNSEVSTFVTISVGVATLDTVDKDYLASDLIEAADNALYTAKQSGRNKVEIVKAPSQSVKTSPPTDINSRRNA